jgi:hypothetical protein
MDTVLCMFWAAMRHGKVERGPLGRVGHRHRDGGAMMAAFASTPPKVIFCGEIFSQPKVVLPHRRGY